MDPDEIWFKNAIIYAVDVHRFRDANGDGRGDFNGLREKLPYLSDLGITCLWLLPCFPSPGRDNGYDIADHYDVDPNLGTFADFLDLLHEAGELSIRIVLDLVADHTSNDHPWFHAARYDSASPYRDYYVWSKDTPPPVPPDKGTIFPGEEDSVWTYDKVAGAYYHHRFYHFEPTLNDANPQVQEEIRRILDFWLSFGISGFRIDAASHIAESQGVPGTETDSPHETLKMIRRTADARRRGIALIGETDVPPEDLSAYFGSGDQLNVLFNFVLNNYLYLSFAREEAAPIRRGLTQLPQPPAGCQWANFLRNLDELDLERITDAERAEVFSQFAPEKDMRIYDRGIRRRLAPMFKGDRRRLELAYSLLFSMPGSPVIPYGDEIGLGEDLAQPGRSAVRLPMQWTSEKNGGFSEADRDHLIVPPNASGPFGFRKTNVASQEKDDDSFLNWLKKLIRVRRQCPEVGSGVWRLLETGCDAVLAHRFIWRHEVLIACHNFAGTTQKIELDLRDQLGRELCGVFGSTCRDPISSEGIFPVELEPYGYMWFHVMGPRSA